VSLRDDNDAAIARIGALEQELALAQETSELDAQRIGMLEREIATKGRRRAPTPVDERSQRRPEIARGWVVVLGLFALIVMWAAIYISNSQTELLR
jgi:hypothetical protein